MRAWLSILAFCIAVMLLGVWRGEGLGGPDLIIDLAIALMWFAGLLVVAWRFRRIRVKSVLVAIAIPASLVGGLYVGDQESTAAFNDCVHRGEAVRVALAAFFDEHGNYPDNLRSLRMPGMPGDRLLRGNVLGYRTTGDGYELFFGDWLVSHYATESSGFTAHK